MGRCVTACYARVSSLWQAVGVDPTDDGRQAAQNAGLSRDQRRTALCVTNVPVERAAQAVGYVRRCGEALAQIDAEVVASSSLDAEHSVRAHKWRAAFGIRVTRL